MRAVGLRPIFLSFLFLFFFFYQNEGVVLTGARWKLLPLCLILLILAVEPKDPQGLCRERKLGLCDSPSWLRFGQG